MTPAVAATDTPQVTDELSEVLVAWRNRVESRPMPEWVTA